MHVRPSQYTGVQARRKVCRPTRLGLAAKDGEFTVSKHSELTVHSAPRVINGIFLRGRIHDGIPLHPRRELPRVSQHLPLPFVVVCEQRLFCCASSSHVPLTYVDSYATSVANYYLNHTGSDNVPLWDFDAVAPQNYKVCIQGFVFD